MQKKEDEEKNRWMRKGGKREQEKLRDWKQG